MRRRALVGFALVVALSVAAVVASIASVTGPGDLARIRSALRLQTSCTQTAVGRPSHAGLAKRWTRWTAQSADVVCTPAGPRLIYARFIDRERLASAVAATLPAGGYCRLGNALVIDGVIGESSTTLSDTCESLGGTFVRASDG